MQKSILNRFIAKFNLNGTADKVLFKASKDGLSTRFMSDDRHVIGEVSTPELMFDDGEYAVYETPQLRNLLNVLGEDVTVKVQKNTGGKNIGLTFSDKSTKATFVLAADASNIPDVPKSKAMPPFEISIEINEEFVDRFSKAKGALPDVETFVVKSDGKTVDLVLGHSDMNTNRITIQTSTVPTGKFEPLNFHARYFKDILLANKEADSGTLEVSALGMARVTFAITDFTVTYYLQKMDVAN